MEHQLYGMPQWLRTTVREPVAMRLTSDGASRVEAFREAFRREFGRLPNQDEVLNWLLGVKPEDRDDG